MEYSLGIMKPDCVCRGLISEVVKMVEIAGLEVVALKKLRLKQSDIDVVYERCRLKDYYRDMSDFLMSDDVCVYLVRGSDAINRLNIVVGDTDPATAACETIRHTFGETIRRNITHSSMSEESFWREIELFFTPNEIKELVLSRWEVS